MYCTVPQPAHSKIDIERHFFSAVFAVVVNAWAAEGMLLSAMPGSSADEQITHFMKNNHSDDRNPTRTGSNMKYT